LLSSYSGRDPTEHWPLKIKRYAMNAPPAEMLRHPSNTQVLTIEIAQLFVGLRRRVRRKLIRHGCNFISNVIACITGPVHMPDSRR
jgi:hypothetical protein